MGPHNPTTRNTQIPTATTTTTFRMVLMLAAMGMKRLISHKATPTTIKATTRLIKGILCSSEKQRSNPLAHSSLDGATRLLRMITCGDWEGKCKDQKRCQQRKPRCLTLHCTICSSRITDVSRVARANGSLGRSAGLLTIWCGPRVDQPFLHCQWAAITLAGLDCSCNRYAHVRALLKQ